MSRGARPCKVAERPGSNADAPPRAGAPATLQVRVKPGARVGAGSLVQAPDGTWLATLRAPPVDGKANAELIALVAARFGCRRAAVSIKAGASGRVKLVRIEPD